MPDQTTQADPQPDVVNIPVALNQAEHDREIQQSLLHVYDGVPGPVVEQVETHRLRIFVQSLDELEQVYLLLSPFKKFSAWCEVVGLNSHILTARFSKLRKSRIERQIQDLLPERAGSTVMVSNWTKTTPEQRIFRMLTEVLTSDHFYHIRDGMVEKWLQTIASDAIRERAVALSHLLTEYTTHE